MEIVLILFFLLAAVVIYLIVNRMRNTDPLNRKCAAEICEYLTTKEDCSPDEIAEIFMRNARYNKQAGHIVSMVPALLIHAGYPRESAMNIVPLLRAAQMLVPK
ncbi:MAG: hypothetical protein WD558_09640 [Pseudomonadales bacterium]